MGPFSSWSRVVLDFASLPPEIGADAALRVVCGSNGQHVKVCSRELCRLSEWTRRLPVSSVDPSSVQAEMFSL